jgi:predicted dienelactone hydrolase
VLDLKHIGVAGHSFGAYTALCIAGRHLIGLPGISVDLRDPRVSACIAMSSPAMQRERANGSYADISIPCFHMTGTEDASMVGESDIGVRRLPFDAMQKSDEYLLDLEGAHHLAFSDNEPVSPPRNPAHWPLIYSSSTAFWDAYLLHDEAALKWLRDGGFTALLGKLGTFEHKSPAANAPQAPVAPKKDG